MSKPSCVEVILRHAGEQEKEYDWVGAAESYEQALCILPNQDLGSLGQIQEKIGHCFCRAAFQAETCEEFKGRVQLAKDHYSNGAEFFVAIGETASRAEFNICKAMASYVESWLVSDTSARKERLNESWKFAKEALELHRKTTDQMNVGKICNDIMIFLTERLNIEWDAESREKIIEEGLECGERAIEIFCKTQDRRQLAQAYVNAAYFCRNAAFAKGLESERRRECREKALSYPQKALDLSEESADSYGIGQSSLCIADARLDILGTAGLEEGQYYEKALQCGTLMKDHLIIADALFGLHYVTNNNAKALEDPDKAREEYAKLDNYWENAVRHGSIIAYNSGIAMACFQMITTMRDRSKLETSFENKRQFLEKSIEVGYIGLKYANLSGSLAPTFHVMLSLGKAMLQLARIQNDTDRKKNLLNESLRLMKQSIGILKQTSAVSLVEPRAINLAFNIWTIAANQVELARVEENVGIKTKTLINSISNAKTAYGFWLEWLRSPGANVEGPFWSLVGANEIETGKALNQLCELTDDSTFLEKGVEAFKRSVDAYEKASLPSLVAETYWQIAKTHDQLAEYSESANNFELACKNYRLATKKMPRLRAFFMDYALYMQAWRELEKARYYQARQEYHQSKKYYERAARLHGSSQSWKHLASNYLAWAQLEHGEDQSIHERSQSAILAFRKAAKLFREAERTLRAKLGIIESADGKDLAEKLIKASDARHEYCLGRIVVEEARILDNEGDHAASSVRYGFAVEKFEKVANALKRESDKRELRPIIYLCKAWQMMTRAEAEASPDLYLKASELFDEAKKSSFNEKAKLLALAHSQFCQALEAGARFEDTRDMKIYLTARKHIEAAENYYLKAAFTSASEYAKATQRVFDAYAYVDNAQKETDPEKEARYYIMAEKVLQTSIESYLKARHPEKVKQVQRLLENVREERELAVSLSEILHAPTITSSTASFVTLTPNEEVAVGLERFEHADVHAKLVQHENVVRVGEDFNLEIQIANVGKETVLLTKIEEILPAGFQLVAKPDYCHFENSHLDMRGKRLGPIKSEEISLVLRPLDKGTFKIRPRIVCVDESGNQLSRELEPVTITVSEVVLSGRVATGYEELDNLLLGGIPENYAVLLTSTSCDERDLIVKNFLEAGAKNDQITFCVTAEAENAADLAEAFQANFNLFVCNPRADLMVRDLPNMFKLKGVESLTEIEIALIRSFRALDASRSGPRRACIEIISDVLLQHHAVITRKWLGGLLTDLRSKGFTTLAVINPLMHPPEEVHAILGLFEGEISIYENETQKGSEKFLVIRKMHNQRYLARALPLRRKE